MRDQDALNGIAVHMEPTDSKCRVLEIKRSQLPEGIEHLEEAGARGVISRNTDGEEIPNVGQSLVPKFSSSDPL